MLAKNAGRQENIEVKMGKNREKLTDTVQWIQKVILILYYLTEESSETEEDMFFKERSR